MFPVSGNLTRCSSLSYHVQNEITWAQSTEKHCILQMLFFWSMRSLQNTYCNVALGCWKITIPINSADISTYQKTFQMGNKSWLLWKWSVLKKIFLFFCLNCTKTKFNSETEPKLKVKSLYDNSSCCPLGNNVQRDWFVKRSCFWSGQGRGKGTFASFEVQSAVFRF